MQPASFGPAQFIQVEFMIKDAQKYRSTEGWGFARWRGDDHKPYGKNANFTTECTSCHAPMKDNDFVYTMPIHDAGAPSDLFNGNAALPADLPNQPLQWRVITSYVDKSHSTMSTLYGNDAAIAQARSAPPLAYPPGAELALVTWQQQEDRHWFGGRIPDKPLSIEYVTVSAGTPSPACQYDIWQGTPLQKQTPPAGDSTAQGRIARILSLTPAAMP